MFGYGSYYSSILSRSHYTDATILAYYPLEEGAGTAVYEWVKGQTTDFNLYSYRDDGDITVSNLNWVDVNSYAIDPWLEVLSCGPGSSFSNHTFTCIDKIN